MPRPRKCRYVQGHPEVTYFKPQGIPLRELVDVYLPVDGFEALRLVDFEGLSMEQAAERMGVSRHIFGRVLAQGRKAVAEALVRGRALRIEGGTFEVLPEDQDAPPEQQDQNIQPQQQFTPQEADMPIVAVTSDGPTLDDQVDPRFGRAAGFVVVNTQTMEAKYIDNGSSQAMAHGAGIQSAQNVAAEGATIVLTGFVGPKAFSALKAAGVGIGQNLDGMTVRQAVEKFKAGEVEIATQPNK